MGWRFRRTLTVGGFRWTVSKRGLGASWGLGGIIRFGVSPDARRYVSLRVPGTGLSWLKYYSRPKKPLVTSSGQGQPSLPSAPQTPSPAAQNPNQSGSNQPWWNQPWWRQKRP